jgi:hypothetical protein
MGSSGSGGAGWRVGNGMGWSGGGFEGDLVAECDPARCGPVVRLVRGPSPDAVIGALVLFDPSALFLFGRGYGRYDPASQPQASRSRVS